MAGSIGQLARSNASCKGVRPTDRLTNRQLELLGATKKETARKPRYQALLCDQFLLPKALNLTGNIPGRTKLLHRELHAIVCRGLISTPQLNSTKISQEDIWPSSLVSNGFSYPILDTRISSVLPRPSFSVMHRRTPPLDSEMGWTGELWSNLFLLILEK